MMIYVNGSTYDTECKDVEELKTELDFKGEVVIVNGFQTGENIKLKEEDTVVLIQKGQFPPQKELESMMAARHTPKVHDAVKKGKVAIAGLGGLGSNIAVMLARTGVGKLLLVDFDVVEPSNLNRQSYYVSHLGLPKTEALKMQIKEINPFIQVETKTVRVCEENIEKLFTGYGVVCEAFDNSEAKAMLINGIAEKLPSVRVVSGSGMAGYESSNDIKTRKIMKNVYICGDLVNEAKPGNGLMAPRVNVCAGHQANMILRLLLGFEEV